MSELNLTLEHALNDYLKKVTANFYRSKISKQKTYFITEATHAQFLLSQVDDIIKNISGNAGEQPEIGATDVYTQVNKARARSNKAA